MALTSTSNDPRPEPIAQHRADAPRWQLHAITARIVAISTLVVVALVAALRPDQAVFRLPHVAVIAASLIVLAAAGTAGVFHR